MPVRAQCAAVLMAALLAAAAPAQVFRVQVGESTLLNAEGGSVEFKAPNYDGRVGLGFYNHRFELGWETRYLFRGYTLLAGDESVPFLPPTDVFDGSHSCSARGIGATRAEQQSRFRAFAGATSRLPGTGFFNAASTTIRQRLSFYDRKLNRRLKFFLSNRQTALHGFEWKATDWMKASVTAGLGSKSEILGLPC
jgi:hypothetical protein